MGEEGATVIVKEPPSHTVHWRSGLLARTFLGVHITLDLLKQRLPSTNLLFKNL